MSQNSRTTLITLGFIVSELHYGPYFSYWWLVSNEDQTIFPIRLGQKVKYTVVNVDYMLSQKQVPPKASPTKAISTAYKYHFNIYTRYSRYQIMGWKDKDILESLKKNIQFTPVNINNGNKNIFIYSIRVSSYEKWCYAGSGFQVSLINTYEKKQSIFGSRFEDKKCIVEIYQESVLKKQFIGKTPNKVWQQTGQLQKFTGIQLFGLDNPITKNLIQQHKIPKCTLNDWNNEDILQQLFNYHVKRRTIAIIELELSLCTIYPSGYEFSECELSAWKTMLHAIGATNITPWSQEESKYQLWMKSINGQSEKVAFAALYKREFLITFWKCFEYGLACNKKNSDGKRRILSIIANEFTYKELEQNLNVGRNTILESRKHVCNEGYGAPILVKPVINKQRFTLEMLKQIENFLNDKEFVNISSYKTDIKTGKPILYLQDTKKALWERFSEEYPNGIRRTSFMTCLEGGQYVYRENLELEQNLNVGRNTILESRKHVCNEGYGAPILVKPVINKQRFTLEMLKQIENFLNDKEFVNISSYKTDIKTGKPILYLQDTKKALWERFSEEYPNGIRRTSFMTCLEGGQYVYRENLGCLCSMCNDVMISAHIMDNNLKKQSLRQSQEFRQYIRRQYSKELEISLDGVAIHNSCISHCIRYAFGACNLDHPITCSKSWMAHYARKTYLNIHVQTNLEELDSEGAVIIVDYKMKILPQSARETKAEFFGKRDWSLHSVLVYIKNIDQNQMNVQTFDHWSDDT
ncbi:hypothetical protein Glove_482g7 [Diversispora epigaea]|uniref:Uncharacterized protein n=1 Tax=Diversispora epigaea TaxID=1348612 RepID=A0A397GNU2_9GLOM|nr:hypothetical protein Glove_482g7 [Diversispora epigaea]